ncbi:MAG TPA: type I DNA topoisomerase [Candidatus Hydrogenedentes bacterium]|nr:type I DNA topoisomerase [Candidatus Hydrogenedentota bacterium]
MPKYLVIVESPAKAKTIHKFLGANYVVRASFGHVRDLAKTGLSVDIENNFEPKYVVLRDDRTRKAVTEIKTAVAKVDAVLLASDPDREGEAIGWHVAEILRSTKGFDKPIGRIVFNEITRRSVQDAVKRPRELDMHLVDAQQARRILDRLVGYKMSPVLGWAVRRGLSAGRVQSVAVRMVCEREDEIRRFVPVEYWSLDADLRTVRGDAFVARLNRVRGESVRVGDKGHLSAKAEVDALLAAIEGAPWQVSSVERKEVQRRPFPPFITSSLQQEASRKLRMSPRKTMSIAQQLYEGISLGEEGSVGLITYMRTDSTRLSQEALQDVRGYIAKTFEPRMLPEQPNVYRSKKDAQDAHEAIRPTVVDHTPESVKSYLTEDQLKVYALIWQRFVACQMAPALYDQTTVDIAVRECEFRATGSIQKFAGFTILYQETQEDAPDQEDANMLPQINPGEGVALQALKPEQHFTKPPARYTEASLIRALEENGIGRPSTYAPTINTIQERGYVQWDKGRLGPTELGEQVNALLVRHFPDILDIGFTSSMEADLDHVEEGNREWHALLREFYDRFSKDLLTAQHALVGEIAGTDVKCPKCGAEMEIREGWFGVFLGCSRYPECDGTVRVSKKAQPVPTDHDCTACGAKMVIREGRFGKFLACSNYPKCKNTADIGVNGEPTERPKKEPPRVTDQPCPKCGAMLVIRKSRTGEEFYGCGKYPKCKFTKPMELGLKCPKPGCDGDIVTRIARGRRFYGCSKYPECDLTFFGQIDKATACAKCGNPWTAIVKGRNKPTVRRCPAPACAFEENMPEPQNEDDGAVHEQAAE